MHTVDNQGVGSSIFFYKKMLLGQNLKGVQNFGFYFYNAFINKYFKKLHGDPFSSPLPPPPTPAPHLCIYGSTLHLDFQVLEKNIFAIKY
jgi:hypothetical protein